MAANAKNNISPQTQSDATDTSQKEVLPTVKNDSEIKTSQTLSQLLEDKDEDTLRNQNTQDQHEDKSIQPICFHYKRGNCKYGMAGNECKYRHPKKCRKFMAYGDKDTKRGCTKGRSCEFYHPRLCRNSVSKKECLHIDCKFVHLKGTRRTKEIKSQNMDNRIEGPHLHEPITTYTYADAAKKNPHQVNQVRPVLQHANANNAIDLSDLLKNIQEKLQTIERQQQNQGEILNGFLGQQQTHYPGEHLNTTQPVLIQQHTVQPPPHTQIHSQVPQYQQQNQVNQPLNQMITHQ